MTLWDALLVAGFTGSISGLITWGGVKKDIFWLTKGVAEAKESALSAHKRIDEL